jgi:hypothetical protein
MDFAYGRRYHIPIVFGGDDLFVCSFLPELIIVAKNYELIRLALCLYLQRVHLILFFRWQF